MKHTALIIILILTATVTGATDISLTEIKLRTTITDTTIATWDASQVSTWQLNRHDLELWLVVAPSCKPGGPCSKNRRIRWQAVPMGRDLMVLKLARMPVGCEWEFKARNLYTGQLIPLPVVWLD